MSEVWQPWRPTSLRAEGGAQRPAGKKTGGHWQSWAMATLGESLAGSDEPARTAAAPAAAFTGDTRLDARQQGHAQGWAEGHESGHAAGWEAGYAEGLAQAQAEQAERIEQAVAAALAPMGALVAQFRRASDLLDERIGQQLAELALAIGRKLADRALEIRPDHILDDVQGLLGDYPSLAGSPTLYVAASDLPQVERHLGKALKDARWLLRADPLLQRGDCRVEDEEREIESSDGNRWERLLQAVGHMEQ